jgi:two-component system, OmpR family, sensor histidine kinase CiaH
MFKKTRTRLVILNTIVFFLILNAFGAFLYFYMEYRLYKQVDRTMESTRLLIEQGHFKDLMEKVGMGEREEERQEARHLGYLLWNEQGEIKLQIPKQTFSVKDIQTFHSALSAPYAQTIVLEGSRPYRILNMELHESVLGAAGNSHGVLQLIYSVKLEQDTLHHLLIVIGLGGIISIVVAVIAGVFLANKALIPIQLAWGKQQEFVADASHELRTPLAVIKLHLERLFRHPDRTIEQESQYISEVIYETRRMSKITSDLLTLARSDSNQLQIMNQNMRIDEVLGRVVQQFQDLAAVKEIQLHSEIDSPIEIIGDEERLYQLFIIVLDNAIKYTKEKGVVSVTCKSTASGVRIEVQDTGIGISKEDLPLIFTRFFRGDKARTRSREGTGLGLSIAKWIIDSHGGKVQVDSTLGVGTHFVLSLPLKKALRD